MSQLYTRPYSRGGNKDSRSSYHLVRTKKKSYYPKAFIGSLLVHSLFLALLATIPEKSLPSTIIVTLDQWQKPTIPIAPTIKEEKDSLPLTVAPAVEATPPPVKVVPPAAVKAIPPPVKAVPPAAVKAIPPPVKAVPPAAVKAIPPPVKVVPPAAVKAIPAPEKVAPVHIVEAPLAVKVGTEDDLAIAIDQSSDHDSLVTTAARESWDFLNDHQNMVEDAGRVLLQISGQQRSFISMPNFDFLESNNFTSRLKMVRIELRIATDGTILSSRIIAPGTGEPALDRELRAALQDAFLNDIAIFGRGIEVATLIINFKE